MVVDKGEGNGGSLGSRRKITTKSFCHRFVSTPAVRPQITYNKSVYIYIYIFKMREKEKSVKGWVDGVLPEGWNEIISFMRYNARV